MNIINKMARELMFGRFPSNFFKSGCKGRGFQPFAWQKLEKWLIARIRPHRAKLHTTEPMVTLYFNAS